MEMEALKAYVKDGPRQSSLQAVPGDSTSVYLHVSHSNLKHYNNELRLPLNITVDALKTKLSRQCGTAEETMVLQLFDDGSNKLADMTEGSRPIGFYSPLDGYRIHIIDLDPTSVTGWLEDTSQVEKYTITEELYNKRTDTFRKFKEKCVVNDSSLKISDDYLADLAATIKVGDRCEVDPGGKRGTIMFVGKVGALAPGFWVGVQYDEPVGKHDGIVKGTRYFTALPGHGAILRPDKVKVGDYTELDLLEDEPDEI